MINFEETIISQYANSPTIIQLVKNMNDCIDPRADIDKIYDFIWNVDAAVGFGLDILGRIVNVGRELKVINNNYFGFKEGNGQPFNQATFYTGIPSTNVFVLADDAYRKLILVKALGNISTLTASSVNQLLQNLFIGRGRCYVNDLGGMRFRYTFEFPLTPYEIAIITQGILPHPAGVSMDLLITSTPVFGFSQMGAAAAPFGQAPFRVESGYYANI
jgi:hypothetical protein